MRRTSDASHNGRNLELGVSAASNRAKFSNSAQNSASPFFVSSRPQSLPLCHPDRSLFLCVIPTGVRGVEGPRLPAVCTGTTLKERGGCIVFDAAGEGPNS